MASTPSFGAVLNAPAATSLLHEGSLLAADENQITSDLVFGNSANDARLFRLLKQVSVGERFAPEELALLDSYKAGLSLTALEVDVLFSRVLYLRFIAGIALSKEQSNLLSQYLVYIKATSSNIAERTITLNTFAGHQVKGPDGSRLWELYSDPALFNQLDGLGRVVERIYGKKGGLIQFNPEAHETFENPFLLSQAQASSTFSALPTSPLGNVFTNTNANDTTAQDTQSETSVILAGGTNVLSSFNDSGSFIGTNSFTGTARSTNGGASFTDQGKLPISAQGDVGDPVFARSASTGTVILTTLDFVDGTTLPVFRSTDNGASYLAPVDGAAGGGGSHDKEWITCDNFGGAGLGNFYMFWRDFAAGGGMTFSRSTNDGVTWGSRQILSAGGQGAQVVVGADHAVYCFWLNGLSLSMRKSVDQGLTFGPAVTVAVTRSTGSNGDLGLNGGFRSSTFPQVVAHPTDPTQLYIVWPDKPVAGPDKANIYFAKTTDGGASWSAPIQVNSDATPTEQWQPSLAITPDGTTLHVSWYDRRLTGTNDFDVFGRHATVAGTVVTWGSDFRINDGASPVVVGQDPVINATYMGDYDQTVGDNSFFYRSWADNRLPSTAHAHQPDVRLAKIPVAGAPANLNSAGVAITAEGCLPANNYPDPGETLTVNLTVTNTGGQPTTSSLVGTLQTTGGVSSPSAPQTYGVIAPGASVSRSFTFVASGPCGTIVPSLQLQDGATDQGTVAYAFTAPMTTQTFTNAASIAIPNSGAGTPYPSTINVTGIDPTYTRATLTLNGVTHTFPADIDIIVVGPGGQKAYVMSDNGGGTDISGLNLTFDDLATATLPNPIVAGTWKPSNIGTTDPFPAPAPANPYDPTFAALGGLGAGANGTWSLYVVDDAAGDLGSIAGGWSLTFYAPIACNTGCGVASADLSITNNPTSGPLTTPGGTITYTFTGTNAGPQAATDVVITNAMTAGTTFNSATAPGATTLITPAVGGNGTITATWSGATASGASHVVNLSVNAPVAALPGDTFLDTATIGSSTSDPNLANNSATSTVTVQTAADLSITNTITSGLMAIPGGNVTYVFNGSNAGPQVATDMVISTTIPTGTTFNSVTAPGATLVQPAVGGTGLVSATWLGATASGASHVVNLSVRVDPALLPGFVIWDTATAASTTPDPNPANNSATSNVAVGYDKFFLDDNGRTRMWLNSTNGAWKVEVLLGFYQGTYLGQMMPTSHNGILVLPPAAPGTQAVWGYYDPASLRAAFTLRTAHGGMAFLFDTNTTGQLP